MRYNTTIYYCSWFPSVAFSLAFYKIKLEKYVLLFFCQFWLSDGKWRGRRGRHAKQARGSTCCLYQWIHCFKLTVNRKVLNGQHHFISGSPIVSGKYFNEMDKQAIWNRLVSRRFKWSTRTHSWKMLFSSPIVVAWRKLTLYVNSNGRENWCWTERDVWVSRLYYFQTLETGGVEVSISLVVTTLRL